jgi:hypothetical protein
MQSEIEKNVWQTVQTLNRAWTVDNNPEKLRDFFHKDMVAVTATDRDRLEGADACVAAWQAFSNSTKINRWREIDPKIQIYGDGKFAVVTYYFEISFDIGGRTIEMSGRDMFSFVNENGKWWVVADQFSPYPA